MADVSIKLMDNGPYLVTGNVEVLDAEGNKFTTNEHVALCRCGHSNNKPFCTGAHKESFEDAARASN